jgi:hypothetical protein
MNFPRYWARGQAEGFFAWRWSSQSLAEAQSLADQAAQQLADRFKLGQWPPSQAAHYYPNHPLREQILQEIKNDAGELRSVITRNSYGCQVLNTARVMFVDIDLPEPKPVGFLQRLFGKAKTAPPPQTQNGAMTKIENWTREHADWGWRVYRTRAGLRLLATHGLVEADSEAAKGVFEALGADPLYQKLCRTQKCYRARLTPKPWRCGVRAKPERWPFLNPRAESKFEKWGRHYESIAFNWATCEFLKHIGNAAVHPDIEATIKFHDAATRVGTKLQLA